MPNCAVSNCRSTNKKNPPDENGRRIHFHTFPSNKAICEVWKQLCKKEKHINQKTATICSRHFKPEDYAFNYYYHLAQPGTSTKRPKLKDTAIPSLNLPGGSDNCTTTTILQKKEPENEKPFQPEESICLPQPCAVSLEAALFVEVLLNEEEEKVSERLKTADDVLYPQIELVEELSSLKKDIFGGRLPPQENHTVSSTVPSKKLKEADTPATKPSKNPTYLLDTSSSPSKKKFYPMDFTITKSKRGGYACRMCNKSFTQGRALSRHFLTVHQGHRPHVCEECGKGFTQSWVLNTHVMCVHRKLRPFVCDDCGKMFSESRRLRNHVNSVHAGLRPYACQQCHKGFGDKGNLRKHIKSVHESEQRLPTISPQWLMALVSQQQHVVEQQQQQHFLLDKMSQHSCKECGMEFDCAVALKDHRKVAHKGSKPHECKECAKSFSTLGNLKQHQKFLHKIPPKGPVVKEQKEAGEKGGQANKKRESKKMESQEDVLQEPSVPQPKENGACRSPALRDSLSQDEKSNEDESKADCS